MSRVGLLRTLFPGWRAAPTNVPRAANADTIDDNRYQTAFRSAHDPLVLLDEQGFFDGNEAAVRLFEANSVDELRACHPAELSPSLQACGGSSRELANQHIRKALQDGGHRFEWLHRTMRGRIFAAEVTLSPFDLHGRRVLQAIVREIASSSVSPAATTGMALATAERRLAAQDAYFKQLFEASPLGVVILDRNEVIQNANAAWQQMFGFYLRDVHGQCINDFIVPAERREEAERISRRILANETVQFQSRRLRGDGKLIEVSFIGAPITVDGAHVGIYGIYTDQTGHIDREREFQRQKEVAELTLSAISDAVVRIGSRGVIAYANQAAERLLGLSQDELLGNSFHELCEFVAESGNDPITFRSLGNDNPTMPLPDSALLCRRDGSSVAVEGAITTFSENGDTGGVIVMRDVSDRRRAQKELAFKATHDSLTGLLNREEMERRIARTIADSSISGEPAALLYVDLDQFKVVNDTCGHQAGDRLLFRVANAIRLLLIRNQVVARLGGDEFAVLLTNSTLAEARHLAEAILETIRNIRFLWQGRLFRIGASIGIAGIDLHSGDVARILAAADSACYAAKDQGRGRVKVADDQDSLMTQRRIEMDWVSRINDALEHDRFVLYRQQILRLTGSRQERHWEVLIRMTEKDGTLVPPDRFIPSAERYGLMQALDRWVIERVFSHLSDVSPGSDTYAINVSGTSLSDDSFSAFITECFAKFRVSPHNICFEITETAAAANLEHAVQFMGRVRKLGCHVSLDDFGSGFSSFTYLKSFEINYLKIDGSFVRDIDSDEVNGVFVESINRIGKSLGIHTIAEYVESAAVLERLREIGVDSAQGHFLDVPKPWIRQ